MKENESDYALSTFQHWEYNLVKVALGMCDGPVIPEL